MILEDSTLFEMNLDDMKVTEYPSSKPREEEDGEVIMKETELDHQR